MILTGGGFSRDTLTIYKTSYTYYSQPFIISRVSDKPIHGHEKIFTEILAKMVHGMYGHYRRFGCLPDE